MKKSDDSHSFIKQVCNSLEESVHALSERELQELTKIRQDALNAIPESDPKQTKETLHSFWRWQVSALVSLGGVAVAVFLLLLRIPGDMDQRSGAEIAASEIDDLEVIVAEVDLDMLYDDIAFYQWMAMEENLSHEG